MPHTETETLERVFSTAASHFSSPILSGACFQQAPLSHTQMAINVTNDLYVAKFSGRFKVLILLDLSAALAGADPFILIETRLTWLPNNQPRLVFLLPHSLTLNLAGSSSSPGMKLSLGSA